MQIQKCKFLQTLKQNKISIIIQCVIHVLVSSLQPLTPCLFNFPCKATAQHMYTHMHTLPCFQNTRPHTRTYTPPHSCLHPFSFTKKSVEGGGGGWSCEAGAESVSEWAHWASAACCRESHHLSVQVVLLLWIFFKNVYHEDAYRCTLRGLFSVPFWLHSLICVSCKWARTRMVRGILHRMIFFLLSVPLLNLLKFKTQRPLGASQPTLQMAGGSEAVSTLKRAKSRGFSPAGEDKAWMGYFHQLL